MTRKVDEQIPKLILSTTEMNNVYNKLHEEKFIYPYFFEVKRRNQILYFLGPHHTFNPKDQQIKSIEKYWNKFLKITKKKNCIALNEGGKRPVYKTREKSIEKHGESGFITYLASKEKVKIYSPELEWKHEVKQLLKKFSKEEIMYFNFARMTAQWNRFKERPNFVRYSNRYLTRNKKELGWKNFNFSIENMVRLHDKKHRHTFDENNYECFHWNSSPKNNPVARSKTRDTYIVSEILKLWERKYSIFTVYGSGHAIIQEPALKYLLNDNKSN